MNGAPMGEFQWALCDACGAWVSTHIYDQLLYLDLHTPQGYGVMMEQVLPVFRGLALFFVQYVLKEEIGGKLVMTHTGPTTSPENSFRMKGMAMDMGIHMYDCGYGYEYGYGYICMSITHVPVHIIQVVPSASSP
ncbi:hypothetical protein EON63_24360 [archaeon]|nr:MAG: hypothetical protein EON63_24360 [archaeon]